MIAFLDKIINSEPYKIILSNPRHGDVRKVSVRRTKIGGRDVYQFESFTATQVFHENVEVFSLKDALLKKCEDFRQIDAFCESSEHSLKISKKGKILTSSRNISSKPETQPHNRQKNYIFAEGTPIPPLVDLGVMTADGKVVKAKSDKFKQINRFIEIINDTVGKASLEEISVLDFGCGKSYLTFILYYYLTEIKHLKTQIIGLDLKEGVINDCNAIAAKYGYDGLHFVLGDISSYLAPFKPDVVISLHACDTATDHAMYNAMMWDAKYCFFVPCCQHEINKQLDKASLPVITDYGITRERFAAILTDNVRARLLSAYGYSVDMMEFIDMLHSPKNILIRAQKKANARKNTVLFNETEAFLQNLNIKHTLCTLLKEHF